VIEQITYLLFLRRLDDLHTLEENESLCRGLTQAKVARILRVTQPRCSAGCGAGGGRGPAMTCRPGGAALTIQIPLYSSPPAAPPGGILSPPPRHPESTCRMRASVSFRRAAEREASDWSVSYSSAFKTATANSAAPRSLG
jgi:hypothetical protein